MCGAGSLALMCTGSAKMELNFCVELKVYLYPHLSQGLILCFAKESKTGGTSANSISFLGSSWGDTIELTIRKQKMLFQNADYYTIKKSMGAQGKRCI